ncbi:MAG: DUF72 domain-containing protein [Wenzhouxiangella sp.]
MTNEFTDDPQAMIGTSGWSYPAWKHGFYPADVPRRRFLDYYTTRFPATELNASFYRLPSQAMIAGWQARTPAGFRFCVKLSRLITHNRRLRDCQRELATFLERIDPLSDRLGPVLAQLPPSLEFDRNAVSAFVAQWAESTSLELAIEARHASWTDRSVSDWLVGRGVIPVVADSGGYWPVAPAPEAGPVYLRYHGPGELYASGYSPQKLGHEAGRIAAWLDEGRLVWAFFNNTDAGDAWRDARRLLRLVRKRA